MGIILDASREVTATAQKKMKTFLCLFVALLAGSTSAELSCDECVNFGAMVKASMISHIPDQTSIFSYILCPMVEDVTGCYEAIKKWWDPMAKAVFAVYLEEHALCEALGPCGEIKNPLSGEEATCEECTAGMNAVAGLLTDRARLIQITDYVKDTVCKSSDDATGCGIVADQLIPYAMPMVSGILYLRSEKFCCMFTESRLCC